MIVSGLWGGNARWHHSVDQPGPDFLYFHFFLCLCICQVTTWCNCVFVYVCSCIFHLCVFLLVSHEMCLFFRPHWAGGCVFVFVDIFLSLCFCISLYWCKCQVAPWCRPHWAGGNTEVTARSRRQCWSCSWWGLFTFTSLDDEGRVGGGAWKPMRSFFGSEPRLQICLVLRVYFQLLLR